MKGNSWIRFVMEGSLDIALSASLNYIYVSNNGDGLKWDTLFLALNNCTLIILVILVLLFPFWSIIFYNRNFENW